MGPRDPETQSHDTRWWRSNLANALHVTQVSILLLRLRFPYRIRASTAAGAGSATAAERGDYISSSDDTQHHDAVMETSRNARGDCRVALLYSGHVRSFAHPRVHHTHLKNLIQPLEVECDVDVFMYLAGERVVLPSEPRMYQVLLFGAHLTDMRDSTAIMRRGVETFHTCFPTRNCTAYLTTHNGTAMSEVDVPKHRS